LQIGDLVRLAALRRRADGFGEVGVVLSNNVDHVRSHSIGRAQLKLPAGLIENIDHAGLGAR
jgi:hypothetical protein